MKGAEGPSAMECAEGQSAVKSAEGPSAVRSALGWSAMKSALDWSAMKSALDWSAVTRALDWSAMKSALGWSAMKERPGRAPHWADLVFSRRSRGSTAPPARGDRVTPAHGHLAVRARCDRAGCCPLERIRRRHLVSFRCRDTAW
jgi:hypothetical protein